MVLEVEWKRVMKHLFEQWEHIQNRIRQAQNLFLFFDFDGTLAPIVSRPELALCPHEVKLLLQKLHDVRNVHLGIISGRSLEDIYEKVGIPGITYVGNHGLSIRNPVGVHKKRLSENLRKEFNSIGQLLRQSLSEIHGVLFEDKGLILAVHYRNVTQQYFGRIREVLEKALEKWGDRWEITHGKMVFEVRPRVDFNKGKAVKEILRIVPPQSLLSVYFGDDRTDEDAFRVLRQRGITVFVGPDSQITEAEFFVKDPSEVMGFLYRCREILEDAESSSPDSHTVQTDSPLPMGRQR